VPGAPWVEPLASELRSSNRDTARPVNFPKVFIRTRLNDQPKQQRRGKVLIAYAILRPQSLPGWERRKKLRQSMSDGYCGDVQIPMGGRHVLPSGVTSSKSWNLLRQLNRLSHTIGGVNTNSDGFLFGANGPTWVRSGSIGLTLAFACGQSSCRVASLALFRRRLVEKHLLAFDHPKLFVTSCTADVFVQTLQGERSSLVVVEQRRFPLRGVVTVDASCDGVLRELLAVNILVAVFALCWRGGEVCRDELGLHVRRLVTIDAGGGLVRSHQGERRLRVVEARELFP